MAALQERHHAAMHVMKTQPTSPIERVRLLAAVCWPTPMMTAMQAERLGEQQDEWVREMTDT